MKTDKQKLWTTNKVSFHRVLIGIIAILCMISGILAFVAIKRPLQKEITTNINTIEERLSYDYSVKVKKSALYPEGEIVKPDSIIFTNLTDQLIIQLDSTIRSDKPVKIEANTKVFYQLVAMDMWERDSILIPERSLTMEGDNFTLLDEEIRIDTEDIINRISTIEEETLVRPNGYQIVIMVEIEGNVFDKKGKVIHELANNLVIPFEITGQYIKFAGESTEKEAIKSSAVEETNIIPQSLIFLGYEVNVKVARLCFGIIFILTFTLLLKKVIMRVYKKRSKVSEIDFIDKKYKSKIIEISDKISLNMLPQLGVKNFNLLIQIADEKEEPILKYMDGTMVYFYVFGNASIYYYGIEKNCDKGLCDPCLNVL